MSLKKILIIAFSILAFCSFSYSTNIIIIAVDTLRADHLGCYGYPRNTSPNIDKFAKDSVIFTNSYAPSPLTTPSFASMLSSLPPYKHGAKRNGMSIFEHIVILPEYLKEYGYYSGAFISTNVLRKKLCGLDKGFNTYSEILNKRKWMKIFSVEGDASAVNEAVSKWLYRNSKRKLFLWVHYIEPHLPYVYHKEFDYGYKKAIPSFYPKGSSYKKIRKYDTEVGYNDYYIGDLIEKIRELDLYNDSLIIFLADHGESFGEHNEYGHGRKLFNSCLHIPLIVKLPGNKNASSEVDRNVSILDVAPTIFSMMDYTVPDVMEGKDLFQSDNNKRVLFFEAYKGKVITQEEKTFQLKVKPIRYGILKNDLKLIFDKKYEAYDIKKDRFELINIYKNPDSQMEIMSDLLQGYIKNVKEFIEYSKKYYKQKSKLSEEDIKKLKALGYIK